MRTILVLTCGVLIGILVASRSGRFAQDSALPPIFKVGQRVSTLRGLTAGETFLVEAINGTWVQVRGQGGATFPYWIKPESPQIGFLECRE
jgi:hypothetical protein